MNYQLYSVTTKVGVGIGEFGDKENIGEQHHRQRTEMSWKFSKNQRHIKEKDGHMCGTLRNVTIYSKLIQHGAIYSEEGDLLTERN